MLKPTRIITSTVLALAISTCPAMANPALTQTKWLSIADAIVKFFVVEGAKTATEITVANALSSSAPEIKISYHIANYTRIQTNSIPNHPVTASIWKMDRAPDGSQRWHLQSSSDGKMTFDNYTTDGIPGAFYNLWSKNCILVHENKAFANHFSERFTIVVQVQVVNYYSLPKHARPTSITLDFGTDAYRLLDPCQPTDPAIPDPNRQDVWPRAVQTISIGADGYGCSRGTLLSPGSFQSYTQAIHTSEITVSTTPLQK